MTPLAPNSKLSDPRIISPSIKVVYPSESIQKDQPVQSVETPVPIPQVLPPKPVKTIELPIDSLDDTREIKKLDNQPEESKNLTAEPTWKDIVKQNAGLFIIVSLVSSALGLLVGILIAKKR